jgi:NADH:ubiquinone oxidoreductase subunit C
MNRTLNKPDFSAILAERCKFAFDYDAAKQILRLDAINLPVLFDTLKNDERFSFEYLRDLTGKEQPIGEFHVVYMLASLRLHHDLLVIAKVAESMEVPSATGFWKSADWLERETYDMFGITFTGHPDLRRIYLEETVSFFPLRKSFKVLQVVNLGDLGQAEREFAKPKKETPKPAAPANVEEKQ